MHPGGLGDDEPDGARDVHRGQDRGDGVHEITELALVVPRDLLELGSDNPRLDQRNPDTLGAEFPSRGFSE